MTLRVELVAPERILYSGEAEMLACRTPNGEIAFLSGHVPFLGELADGDVRIVEKAGGAVKIAHVSGGFVEVAHDTVSILADQAELRDSDSS